MSAEVQDNISEFMMLDIACIQQDCIISTLEQAQLQQRNDFCQLQVLIHIDKASYIQRLALPVIVCIYTVLHLRQIYLTISDILRGKK